MICVQYHLCRAPISNLCPISLDYPGFTFSTQGRLCAVKQGVRHLFGRAYLSQNPIYYSWFSKGGEGENVSVTKALRGQKHLRSSGKGPQKWETGGWEPPGPEYRLTPLLGLATERLKVCGRLMRHYETWQNMHYCANVGSQFSICVIFSAFSNYGLTI